MLERAEVSGLDQRYYNCEHYVRFNKWKNWESPDGCYQLNLDLKMFLPLKQRNRWLKPGDTILLKNITKIDKSSKYYLPCGSGDSPPLFGG